VYQLERVRTAVRQRVFHKFDPKNDAEFEFWRKTRADAGGTLRNSFYEQLFTDQFGLTPAFFAGKRVLDIGCGPRGSLEWAAEAARRVGLDPLADRYRELGIDEHAMEYISSAAEEMPFPDGSFDIVSSLNSLDHVDDLHAALDEIARVLVSGGSFLLEVEFGHKPTETEPIEIPGNFAESLQPTFQVVLHQRYESSAERVHSAYVEAVPYREGKRHHPGLLVAHLVKR
jgi:ubiquinone/menaquinone biosynthesis C-methylase UbiE